jgi:hypothetical protein
MASAPDHFVIGLASNQSGFDRLRWNVFDSMENIQVSDDAGNGDASCSPLLGHTICSEPATNPPKSQLTVIYKALAEHEHWRSNNHEPPPPLIINKADQTNITVYDLIQAVDQYVKNLHDTIVLLFGLSHNEKLWFDGFKYDVVSSTLSISFFKESTDPSRQHWTRHAQRITNDRLWAKGVSSSSLEHSYCVVTLSGRFTILEKVLSHLFRRNYDSSSRKVAPDLRIPDSRDRLRKNEVLQKFVSLENDSIHIR